MKNKPVFLLGTLLVVIVAWWSIRAFQSETAPIANPTSNSLAEPASNPAAPSALVVPSRAPSATSQLAASVSASLLGRRTRLEWPELAALKEQDLPPLKQAYRQTTNLLDKLALTQALGVLGDAETVDLLRQTLLEDYAGHVLIGSEGGNRGDETMVMLATVEALGLLAGRHEVAWELLRAGTAPAYWKKNLRWESSYGQEAIGLMTGECLAALGLSGRPEVPALLQQMKDQPLLDDSGTPPEQVREFYGAVMQAAYYDSLLRQFGREGFGKIFFGDPNHHITGAHSFEQWCKTPPGKIWQTWYEKRNRERQLQLQRLSPPGR